VVCGAVLAYCFWMFGMYLFNGTFYLHNLSYANIAFGAFLWGTVGWKFGGFFLGYLLITFYYCFMAFLFKKTFSRPYVAVWYPITFLVIMALGHYFNILALSGF
jgi:hypothetical protein